MPDSPRSRGGSEDAALPAHAAAKARWRTFLANRQPDQKPDLSVAIAASFTAEPLGPMIGTALLDLGLVPSVSIGPYNQLFQTCLDPRAQFGVEPDVIVLLWRTEDLLASELTRFTHGDRRALNDALLRVDELAQAIAQLRGRFGGGLLITLPAFPLCLPIDPLDLDGPHSGSYFHRAVLQRSLEAFAELRQVRMIDLDALQSEFGARAAFDARKWYLYRQPYAEAFLWELGSLAARVICAGRSASRKCAVVDCDNTLWAGVVGEDGSDSVELGEDFPGSAYRDIQRLFLHWRRRGVLLAIASQNNEADVWEVFERHDGMVLKRDDFSAWEINWDPKPLKLRRIAAALNIGVDSLVFIDDNPFEIEQVKEALPEVETVLLDGEPARMLSALKARRLFDRLEITEEDAKRADMMRAEQARAEIAKEQSPEDFIRALGLRVEFGRAKPHELVRVAQLINKTNQFNLTTRRRSLEEVEALAAGADQRIYTLRVSDKFGEYGLVGVAILETAAPGAPGIDTFLLSCRVLGRGVETAFLAGIASEARNLGADTLHAAFIPTRKNAPAAGFLAAHGFRQVGGTNWTAALTAVPALPAGMELQVSLEA